MNTPISQDFRNPLSVISRLNHHTEKRTLMVMRRLLNDAYIKGMDIFGEKNKRVIMKNFFVHYESIRIGFGRIGYIDSKKSRRLGQ